MKTFLIKTGLFVALLTLTSSGKIGNRKIEKKINKTLNEFENKYIDEGSVYYGIAEGRHFDKSEAKAFAVARAEMLIGSKLNSETESALKIESSSDGSNMAGKMKTESIKTNNSNYKLDGGTQRIEGKNIQLKNGINVYIVVVRYDVND